MGRVEGGRRVFWKAFSVKAAVVLEWLVSLLWRLVLAA